MKIKWKIITVSVGVIVLLAASIILVTNSRVNNLVFAESSEELRNYSNMGFQLLD